MFPFFQFSLADLGPDLLTHPQTETTRASSNIKTSVIIEPTYVDEELIHVFEHNPRRIVKKDSITLFNFGMLTWPHERLKKKKMSLLESPVSTSSFSCGPKALIKKSGNFLTQKRSKWVNNTAYLKQISFFKKRNQISVSDMWLQRGKCVSVKPIMIVNTMHMLNGSLLLTERLVKKLYFKIINALFLLLFLFLNGSLMENKKN